MMVLPSVDLPAPLGPMSTWTSPGLTVRSTPCRMGFSPTWVLRPVTLSRADSAIGSSILSWGFVGAFSKRVSPLFYGGESKHSMYPLQS